MGVEILYSGKEVLMADLSEKDKELVEHLSRCIIAAGIFRGLECGNIAATQDAIHKIAKAFDVDLSISEDRVNNP